MPYFDSRINAIRYYNTAIRKVDAELRALLRRRNYLYTQLVHNRLRCSPRYLAELRAEEDDIDEFS